MVALLTDLEQKARSGAIEVEDVLGAADMDAKDAVPLLKRLSDECGWLDFDQAESLGAIPLKDWAHVVCAYLEGGFDFLQDEAVSPTGYTDRARLVIALLEHLHTVESVRALIAVFESALVHPERDMMMAKRVAEAINLLLSFEPKLKISAKEEQKLRDFLHKLLEISDDDGTRGTIYCALRGVGDSVSIKLIKDSKRLQGKWFGIERVAIKAIEQR